MRARILNRDIARIVCSLWPVTLAELVGQSRVAHIVRARQAAYWLGVWRGGHSRAAVGRFYRRDHTAVLHGLAAVERRRVTDPVFACRLDACAMAVALLRPSTGPDCPYFWPAPVMVAATFQSVEVLR